MASSEEPPYLNVGTDVSAKYKGAFCEAKITEVNRNVKIRVVFEGSTGSHLVDETDLKLPPGASLEAGLKVEAKHPEKKQQIFVQATISKILDHSRYTVVFDDGDRSILRRNSICPKSGKHFAESETLDQLPLTNPEHFGNPVKVGVIDTSNNNNNTNHSNSNSTHHSGNSSSAPSTKLNNQTQHDKTSDKASRKSSTSTAPSTTGTVVAATNSTNLTTTTSLASSSPTNLSSPAPRGRGRGAVSKGRKRRESTSNISKSSSTKVEEDECNAPINNSDSNVQDLGDSNVKYESIDVGVKLMVQYGKGKVQNVYEAKVNKVALNSNGDPKYYVHYTGWNNRYDEWIPRSRILNIVTEKENGTKDGRSKQQQQQQQQQHQVETTAANTTHVPSTATSTPTSETSTTPNSSVPVTASITNSCNSTNTTTIATPNSMTRRSRLSKQAAATLTTTSASTAGTTETHPKTATDQLATNNTAPVSASITNITTMTKTTATVDTTMTATITSSSPSTPAPHSRAVGSRSASSTTPSKSISLSRASSKASRSAAAAAAAVASAPPTSSITNNKVSDVTNSVADVKMEVDEPASTETNPTSCVSASTITTTTTTVAQAHMPKTESVTKISPSPAAATTTCVPTSATESQVSTTPTVNAITTSTTTRSSSSSSSTSSTSSSNSSSSTSRRYRDRSNSNKRLETLCETASKAAPSCRYSSSADSGTSESGQDNYAIANNTSSSNTVTTNDNATKNDNGLRSTEISGNQHNQDNEIDMQAAASVGAPTTNGINGLGSAVNINGNGVPSPSSSSKTISSTIHRFCDDIDESDCDKKISILQDRIMALRQTYISLKSELVDLDRRRKRPRTERSTSASNNSDHMNCSLTCRN